MPQTWELLSSLCVHLEPSPMSLSSPPCNLTIADSPVLIRSDLAKAGEGVLLCFRPSPPVLPQDPVFPLTPGQPYSQPPQSRSGNLPTPTPQLGAWSRPPVTGPGVLALPFSPDPLREGE